MLYPSGLWCYAISNHLHCQGADASEWPREKGAQGIPNINLYADVERCFWVSELGMGFPHWIEAMWLQEQSLELVSKIRVVQNDTLSLPNTQPDGGSTTSEGTCAAVQKCCAVLVQRLLPVKEKLVQAQPDGRVPWETLCLTVQFHGTLCFTGMLPYPN